MCQWLFKSTIYLSGTISSLISLNGIFLSCPLLSIYIYLFSVSLPSWVLHDQQGYCGGWFGRKIYCLFLVAMQEPWRTLCLMQHGFAGSSLWSERSKEGPDLLWATVNLTRATGVTGCHGGKGSPKVRLKRAIFNLSELKLVAIEIRWDLKE